MQSHNLKSPSIRDNLLPEARVKTLIEPNGKLTAARAIISAREIINPNRKIPTREQRKNRQSHASIKNLDRYSNFVFGCFGTVEGVLPREDQARGAPKEPWCGTSSLAEALLP